MAVRARGRGVHHKHTSLASGYYCTIIDQDAGELSLGLHVCHCSSLSSTALKASRDDLCLTSATVSTSGLARSYPKLYLQWSLALSLCSYCPKISTQPLASPTLSDHKIVMEYHAVQGTPPSAPNSVWCRGSSCSCLL